MKSKYFLLSMIIVGALISCVMISSFFALGYFTGRGSGNVVTEVYDLEEFNYLQFKGQGNIYYTQGDDYEVVVSAEDNILDRMNVIVKSKKLSIDYERDYFWPFGSMIFPTKEINVYVKAPDIDKLRFDGTANFSTEYLDTKSLEIQFNGAGKLKIDGLHVDSLKVNIDGVSECFIKGSVSTQKIIINGAGKYYADSLISDTAEIDINGSADVSLYVSDKLDAVINGTGKIIYKGDPTTVDKKINGVGEIRKY